MTRTARSDETRRHDLVLTFDELAMIYKSLQAVKTLSLRMPRESRRWRGRSRGCPVVDCPPRAATGRYFSQ
jgi:hypothetical protein